MRPFVDIADASFNYEGRGGVTPALAGVTLRIDQGRICRRRGPVRLRKVDTASSSFPASTSPRPAPWSVAERAVSGPLNIVGMAFQNPVMLPWRTTVDNVLLPLEIVEPHASRLRTERQRYRNRARESCRWSVSTDLPIIIRGNCPAACSSAPRCAVR